MNHNQNNNNKIKLLALKLYYDKKAIAAVEYGLMAALISAIIITGLMASGVSIKSTLGVISSVL